MDLKELKEKLKNYSEKDIIITDHAKMQAIVRNVELSEVKQNVLNPQRLIYTEGQKSVNPHEEKYVCYFSYSEKLCHKYILVINRKIIIVTIIIINRDWQKTIKKFR